MYTVFFRCLKQCLLICDKTIKLRHSCSSLLEHLWWEWSSNFDAYKEFALIYYYELGQMLHLFLSDLELKAPIFTTGQQHFLIRYQTLSRCLDYYDHVLTPNYQDLYQKRVFMIKNSNQKLLTIFDKVPKNQFPQSASSASFEKCSAPGTIIKDDSNRGE